MWLITLLFTASILFNSCTPTPNPSDKERIQEVDNSLNEVFDMFSRAGTTIGQPDVIMIIFILRQHFNLTFSFPTLSSLVEKRPYLSDRYFKLYDHYFDDKTYVNYSDADVWAYLDQDLESDLNALTFWSMYCNKFPLDKRFIKTLESKLKEPPVYPNLTDKRVPPPEYWPLHAALQLHSAQNANCLSEIDSSKALMAKVVENLANLAEGNIETTQYDQDISTEAIAMLFYTNNDSIVREEMINNLLSNQLTGGGWSYSSSSESVSLHTSVLAMWVLLEYKESIQNS